MAEILNTSVSADGNTDRSWKPLRKETSNIGTIAIFGSSFGSGTAALQASFDGGTTFIAVLDVNGNAISLTANGIRNFILNSDLSNQVVLRINLSGSTNPSITYVINDVR